MQPGAASCPPARSLELRVHLSYRGHGLNAQCRCGHGDVVSVSDMDHELTYQGTDVMPLFDMGAACEDVCTPQLFDHPEREEVARAEPRSKAARYQRVARERGY